MLSHCGASGRAWHRVARDWATGNTGLAKTCRAEMGGHGAGKSWREAHRGVLQVAESLGSYRLLGVVVQLRRSFGESTEDWKSEEMSIWFPRTQSSWRRAAEGWGGVGVYDEWLPARLRGHLWGEGQEGLRGWERLGRQDCSMGCKEVCASVGLRWTLPTKTCGGKLYRTASTWICTDHSHSPHLSHTITFASWSNIRLL